MSRHVVCVFRTSTQQQCVGSADDQECEEARGRGHVKAWGGGESQEQCVSWLGGDLPTEEEWEKAGRGTDERESPWGNAAPTDCTQCNWDYTSSGSP